MTTNEQCTTTSFIPLLVIIIITSCSFITLLIVSIVSVKVLKQTSPSTASVHNTGSNPPPISKQADGNRTLTSTNRQLSYMSSINADLEDIMEEVLLLSDLDEDTERSSKHIDVTPSAKTDSEKQSGLGYKAINTQDPEEPKYNNHTSHASNLTPITPMSPVTPKTPETLRISQWGEANGCCAKFKLYTQDIYLRRRIYLSILCHIADVSTDIGAVTEFGIVAVNSTKNQCSVNVWYIFICSIICMVLYRIISSYKTWQITSSCKRTVLQFIDVEIYRVLYISHFMGLQERSLPHRLLSTIEIVFEAAPQCLIQLIYLLSIKNESIVVILSVTFSVINIIFGIIGENKYECNETTDIGQLLDNDQYQNAVELIVFNYNGNTVQSASKIYGNVTKRYSLLAISAACDGIRIFDAILTDKGLDDFPDDDEYISALMVSCCEYKLDFIQKILCTRRLNVDYINKRINNDGKTALGYLITNGTLEMIKWFLKCVGKWLRRIDDERIRSAILNTAGGNRGTALHLVCLRQKTSFKLFKVLYRFYGSMLNKQAALETRNIKGQSVPDCCGKRGLNEIKSFILNQQLILYRDRQQ